MANYSKSPLAHLNDNLTSNYWGIHVERGVPVLDRDLNLLHDLISARVRQVIERYIGNGVATGAAAFAVTAIPANNDFRISPGTCLVGGIEVTLGATTNYTTQTVPPTAAPPPPLPALTTATVAQPNPRPDIVYLDVWLDEVDQTADPALANPSDVGMQTSVRQKPMFVVRVAENSPTNVPPAAAVGHVHYALARLLRPTGNAQIATSMITDLRSTRLNMVDIERRMTALERLFVPAFSPVPNQFAPKVGTIGQNVTLSGRNFNIGTTVVRFGSITAVTGTITPTTIATVVPPGVVPGPLKISVTTDAGSVVSDENFTVLPSAPPGPPPGFAASPNQFAPKVGSPGQAVTLFGTSFNGPNPTVSFGGTVATVGVVTPTTIQTVVPVRPPGAIKITVTTDWGTDVSDDNFTVLP
jgi:hypothetical protein